MDIPYDSFIKQFDLKEFTGEAHEKPLHFVWRFSLNITAHELWPSIADTSRFNRDLGMAPRQEREVDGKKIVTTTLLGFKQEWIEEPWTWILDKKIGSNRTYIQGLAKTVNANFCFAPTAEGVDFYVNFSWIPRNKICHAFLLMTAPLLKGNFIKILDKIEKFVLSRNQTQSHALKHFNDPTKNVNLPELEKAALALKNLKLNPVAVDGLCEFIKTGDDIDLFRIQVIPLAKSLNIAKNDCLVTCMNGVRQGLLAISWNVICPHCRGVRLEADSLGKIPAKYECFVCDIDFETDTLESIEVVFHVHPSFRHVPEVLFCAAEPAKKDHIQVQQKVLRNSTLCFTTQLQEGRHRMRVAGQSAKFLFEVKSDAPSMNIFWSGEESVDHVVCGPESRFTFENKMNETAIFTIEQRWWKDNSLHPADVFAIQEFHDVFSRESINSDVRISLGVQTILFTDIVNSTGFYNTKGDASAFNDVKKHFTEVFTEIGKYNGVVIKTIGDSVMATFMNAEEALEASVAIQKIFHKEREDLSIRVRIALHLGQVIAVHLLQGLDLFGATINKGAKLQIFAGAGEIAMSKEFYQTCESALVPAQSFTRMSQAPTAGQTKDLIPEAYVFDVHENMAFDKASTKKIPA